MARAFKFDVDRVTEQLDRILQMELAGVIYYTHYSFMIYGHARIPITAWLRENATESLTHAQEAGEMIMRLHRRPALGIAALPTTRHNSIDEIVSDALDRGRGSAHPGDGAHADEARPRVKARMRADRRHCETRRAEAIQKQISGLLRPPWAPSLPFALGLRHVLPWQLSGIITLLPRAPARPC